MTDRQALFQYRLGEAEETPADAKTMLANAVSGRAVVNRAYYAIFYAVIALLIAREIEYKTSKHSGIISVFDREIVHAGLLGRDFSRVLHRAFEARQESDYKEFVVVTGADAAESVRQAEYLVSGVKALIG